jgi:methylmalonyl-CoA/ethylmalonyl-CoA epimerase
LSTHTQMTSIFGPLNHVAALVRDLPAAIEKYQTKFGAILLEQETLANGADIAVIDLGGLHVELLSTRQPDSKVGKLLDELGEGIHHLSFEVADLESTMAQLRQTGIRLRDQVPRSGLHGRPIAFIEPKDTFGVLIELVGETAPPKEL